MQVLYFVRDETKTGISSENKPYKIRIIELKSYFEEIQYLQGTGKEESSFRKIDESKIRIVEHDNKVVEYEIDIDFMNNSSSCAGFNNAQELIEFNKKYDMPAVSKQQFLATRQSLIQLARPFFKIHFDCTTHKQFYYKKDNCRYFYDAALYVLIDLNNNSCRDINVTCFDFFLSKVPKEAGSVRIDSKFGGYHESFKEAVKYLGLKRGRTMRLSKRNFHRILKQMIRIFDTKQYIDYDAIENKQQDYRVTVLNF